MVITLGESVFDIIFEKGAPVASVHGGSMYNVAVSLGRTGKEVSFAGFYANDIIGQQAFDFLTKNKVHTDLFHPVQKAKSNLALAFLNEQKVPEYNFYRDAKLGTQPFNIDFSDAEALIIGSFYAIDPANFPFVKAVVEMAIQKQVPVLYDPNVRGKHLQDDSRTYDHIAYFIQAATVTKLSAEDLFHITGKASMAAWRDFLNANRAERYVLTQGADSVLASFDGAEVDVDVSPVNVKNSVGAGDAFTAGFVSYSRDVCHDKETFFKAVERGAAFGSHVCTRHENYISQGFAIQ